MASNQGDGYGAETAPKAFPPIEGLGPMMSTEDETYMASAAFNACCGGGGPDCDTPGFDPVMLPDPDALLGRWVRSPSRFVGWDVYMEFFGLSGAKALQETEEPQEHVILEFSKEKLRLNHRLCWRDGLDCEYTVPLDGSAQPVPPAMVARASSSWKVNDQASWEHAWDNGAGNPLHRGLRTQQKLVIGGTSYALRYWRSLIRPRLMRINVEVTNTETGKFTVHTQRFFNKVDVDRVYSIGLLPPSPMADLSEKLLAAALMTHGGRGVRLALLPHACNMPAGYKEMAKDARWEAAEPFPTAGRSSGPFLSALRQAAREAGVWVCCGVELRADTDKDVVKAAALIGADGWLHGVHVEAKPSDAAYSAGSGDWPATQRDRPRGVYDTELGRIAICTSTPDAEGLLNYAQMGAEVILQPPDECKASSGHAVALLDETKTMPHKYYTQYELCGPEPWDRKRPDGEWKLFHVSEAVQMSTTNKSMHS